MWLLVLQARNVKQKNCIWKKNNKSGQMGFARFHCDRGCAERYNWQRQAVAVTNEQTPFAFLRANTVRPYKSIIYKKYIL